MRILICGINYFPELTGIGKYTGEMAEWLANQGHQVRVVTAPPYYPMWQISPGYSRWRYTQESLNEVRVYRCPLWVPSVPSGFKRVLHLASFALSSFWILVWQGFWWQPHIVWVVEPPFLMAPGALVSGFVARCRTWLHVQDFEIDAAFDLDILALRRSRGFVNRVERWIMKLFDNVSTISEPMINRLITKGLDKQSCVYFPNWIDTDGIFPLRDPSPMRRELGIPDGDTVALYAGN
ncbi:MAG: WcaI family glycosyltransferase, partial [Nitrospirales bacterium]|nr:WcaI family glycosyltransferase [Nitrospirales bacterium]